MKRIFTLIILVFAIQLASAQTPPDGLVGQPFRNWVKQNFYDGKIDPLGYSEARNKMYSYIENFNDTVECVYSGYKKYVQNGSGITNPAPINAEHIVPQSLFDEAEPARGDIHNLYPTYDLWNNKRGNLPFAEIDDNDTDEWFFNTTGTSSTPAIGVRDNYSELQTGTSWEPRENRKGDVARAIFYFFTMYPSYDMRDVGDVNTFCDWHKNDPVDSREITRNELVFAFQDNYNPYYLNQHWANYAYGCEVEVPSGTTVLLKENQISIFPNPIVNKLNVSITDWQDFPLSAEIYDMQGKVVMTFSIDSPQLSIELKEMATANYLLFLKNSASEFVGTKKLMVQ
jgi:endonuclease I